MVVATGAQVYTWLGQATAMETPAKRKHTEFGRSTPEKTRKVAQNSLLSPLQFLSSVLVFQILYIYIYMYKTIMCIYIYLYMSKGLHFPADIVMCGWCPTDLTGTFHFQRNRKTICKGGVVWEGASTGVKQGVPW